MFASKQKKDRSPFAAQGIYRAPHQAAPTKGAVLNPLYDQGWQAPAPASPQQAAARGEPFSGLFDEGLPSRAALEGRDGAARLWQRSHHRVLRSVEGYHQEVRAQGHVRPRRVERARQALALKGELLQVRQAVDGYGEGQREQAQRLHGEVEGERRLVEGIEGAPAYDDWQTCRPWEEALALGRLGGTPTRDNRVDGHVDANLKGAMTPLGRGGVNQVFQGMYEGEGRLRVWKEELRGPRQQVEDTLGIPDKGRNYAARNVALSRLDALLGTEAVPQTDLAMHEGRIGTVMDKVEGGKHGFEKEQVALSGDAAAAVQQELETLAELKRTRGGLSGAFLRERDEQIAELEERVARLGMERKGGRYHRKENVRTGVDYALPVVRRGLSNLQLLDALAGSGDRHAGNYMFATDRSGAVTGVKGIDNDFAFSRGPGAGDPEHLVHRPGARKPGSHNLGLPDVIDGQVAARVLQIREEELRACLGGLLAPEEVDAAAARLASVKARLQQLMDEGKLVSDWSQADQQAASPGKASYWSRDKGDIERMPLSSKARRS